MQCHTFLVFHPLNIIPIISNMTCKNILYACSIYEYDNVVHGKTTTIPNIQIRSYGSTMDSFTYTLIWHLIKSFLLASSDVIWNQYGKKAGCQFLLFAFSSVRLIRDYKLIFGWYTWCVYQIHLCCVARHGNRKIFGFAFDVAHINEWWVKARKKN